MLTDSGQWTEPWGSSEDQTTCDKCEGGGRTQHECWSCLLTEAKDSCPVCHGVVRWEDQCPVCRGTGKTDGDPRHGVSVFPTVEGLYHYMLVNDADLDSCTIVELDAELADDVDFDADQGAMLVIPTAIRGCGPVDRELIHRIEERSV